MPDGPIRDAWARQIALAHGGMAVVAVTASVKAYVNAVIAMAIVYLFRPATALIVLTLAWAGLAGVLGWQMRRCIKPSAKAATARSLAALNRTDRP
ncbi:hypothetical protein [Tepidimonas sp.]|uniref:hypothetical protein n=1 Tax=Tepidimonas sp. TaxID=2002775 RepID=UPI0028CCA243|nr:hypothetical protein [Tepidimonas sp.]MDT7928210.1 hypothetical protein [Tepidimonas sp.]